MISHSLTSYHIACVCKINSLVSELKVIPLSIYFSIHINIHIAIHCIKLFISHDSYEFQTEYKARSNMWELTLVKNATIEDSCYFVSHVSHAKSILSIQYKNICIKQNME